MPKSHKERKEAMYEALNVEWLKAKRINPTLKAMIESDADFESLILVMFKLGFAAGAETVNALYQGKM